MRLLRFARNDTEGDDKVCCTLSNTVSPIYLNESRDGVERFLSTSQTCLTNPVVH